MSDIMCKCHIYFKNIMSLMSDIMCKCKSIMSFVSDIMCKCHIYKIKTDENKIFEIFCGGGLSREECNR
jgi:hypothetical protein